MKRWLALAAGGFGLAAYIRRRRRRADWIQAGTVEAEPAEELRAKLARTREEEQARPDEPVAATGPAAVEEPVASEPEAPADAVGERRESVHERARAAMDELG